MEFGWLASSGPIELYRLLRITIFSLVTYYLAVRAAVRWEWLCPA